MIRRGRVALALAVALGVVWPHTAKASPARDVSFKATPFATAKALPQLQTPAEDALAMAARADECEALCELAASVEEAPFGYVLGRRPPLGRIFLYDDTSLLAEYDTNGAELAKYDYGADRLIRLTRTDEGTRYMTFDGLGSVTGLTTTTGAVTVAYHLDAWGNYRFTQELALSKNRFGFTGHYWDNEAGLYYAKARYYDPFTARFTQADSFLGNIDDPPSLHRYQYAHANPTRFVDEDGHSATVVGAAAGFMWGFGQMVGAGIDDLVTGRQRGTGAYLSMWAQNTIGGAEIGASIDLGLATAPLSLTPGMGAVTRAAVGALAGAGANSLTFGGSDGSWSTFAGNQAMGAGVGAAVGLVPELGVGLSAYGAYEGYKTAQAGAPEVGYTQMALSIAPFFSKEVRDLSFGRMRRVVSEQILPRLNPFNYEWARPTATASMFGGGQGPKYVGPSAAASEGLVLARVNHGKAPFSELNSAIAEARGWQNAIDKGQVGIRPPTKASAGGVDYVTFDPTRGEVVLWDAKYRRPGGRYPSSVPATKTTAWKAQARAAAEAMPESPVRLVILDALARGKVRTEIFRWPQ